MNLNRIAGAAVSSVSRPTMLIVRVSDGYDILPDKSRVPKYLNPQRIMGQVQNLTFRDLQQIEALNLQGTRKAIYLNGHIHGIVRKDQIGGDLITIEQGEDAGDWLVAMVLESWATWCKVAVTLQRRPTLAPAAGA